MERNNRISFENYLCLQRYAEKTQKAYLYTIADLSSFHQQAADELTNKQVQDYLLYCIKDKKLEWSSCNIRFCALKKYYQDYLGYDDSRFSIPPRPRSRKLPMLLSQEEVQRILQVPTSLKHRALLTTVYGSGLRVGEAVRLRPEHIESNRMQIRVEQAKGRKDRYTVLSQKCLELLRVYWRIYKPGQWLFFGKNKNKPMPVETAQRAYYRAKEEAGINKGLGIHTLRHCFASHAMEQGVEIFIIKRWLGHSSIRTTCTYLHTSPKQLREVVSPLDLPTQGGK
jgi:integrase/recombinase XerD